MRPTRIWTAFVLLIAVPALATAADHVPDELIVRFKPSHASVSGTLGAASFSSSSLSPSAGQALQRVGAVDISSILTARRRGPAALSSQAALAGEPLVRTYRVRLPPGSDVAAAVDALARDPSVELAEPNFLMRLSALPNDSGFSAQWHHRNSGQAGSQDFYDPALGTVGADIDSENAWNAETGASGVIVAVIDSGLDTAHPDIAGNLWTNPDEVSNGLDDDGNGVVDDLRGANMTNDTGNVSDDCGVEEGHGTHVAGIIGAVGNNAIGVAGVAWDVQVMPIKVAQAGTCSISTLDIAQALNYAVTENADIVNMSLGGPASVTLQTAVAAADAAGLVLVAAAGNGGIDFVGDPAAEYPAAYTGVLGVAATNRNDQRPTFSNYGTGVDLAAPGVAVRSTWPTADGSYAYLSGTSMASPVVAGIAALVKSQYPALTADEIDARLTASCENIGVSGMGAGRVNAARALLDITGISPTQAPSGENRSFTLSGVSFHSGVSFRLTKTGSPTVTATNVSVVTHDQATCDFNVPSASTGIYNVEVVIGQTVVTLPAAVEIFGLNVTAISPSIFPTGAGTGPVTVTGQNFGPGIAFHIEKSGETDIAGTGLVIGNATTATVEFDLTGATGGRWDVVVTSGPFEVSLERGMAVTSPVYQVVTPPVGSDSQYTMSLAPGNAVLDWPANATSAPINIDIDGNPVLPAVDGNRDPFAATGIGIGLEQVGSNPTFSVPYRLTLPYQLADLTDPAKESALTLAFFNTSTNRWEPLRNVEVDTVARTVSGTSNHFSVYQIVQHVPSANLDRSVAFPNPFRPDRGHDRIVFDFLMSGSTVKVYDLAGRLVRELRDDDGDGRIDWLGVTNEDGDRIASGVYHYLAIGGGQTKSGRVAVVR